MAPFDSAYTTFYLSAIVTIALSCTVEIWVRGHSRSFKLVHSKAWVQFPIRLP